MSIGDFFKGFLLDTWYKALVYVGGFVFILSLVIESKGIKNIQLQLIGMGMFLIGIGEWKNHKKYTEVKPPNVYTGPTAWITVTRREPDIIGIIFDVAGVVLLLIGIIGASKSAIMGEVPSPTPITSPSPLPMPTFTPIPTDPSAITPTIPVKPSDTPMSLDINTKFFQTVIYTYCSYDKLMD